MGKFDDVSKEFEVARRLWKPNFLSIAIGRDYYDYVLLNIYTKTFNIDLAIKLIDAVTSRSFYQVVISLDESVSGLVPGNIFVRGLICDLMLTALLYETKHIDRDPYEKNADARIESLFSIVHDTASKNDAILFLAELLGYKYSDGKYHSDAIFALDSFRMRFRSFAKLKGLKISDLSEVYKLAHRPTSSSLFDKMWAETVEK